MCDVGTCYIINPLKLTQRPHKANYKGGKCLIKQTTNGIKYHKINYITIPYFKGIP